MSAPFRVSTFDEVDRVPDLESRLETSASRSMRAARARMRRSVERIDPFVRGVTVIRGARL
jgi:hypothetical protein